MSVLDHEPLLAGINYRSLSKEEVIFLKAEILFRICEELKEIFKIKYKDYFCTLRFTKEMERAMLEEKFVGFIIEDIISTEEYTPAGIAYYIHTAEDVIIDITTGINTNPSSQVLRKIIGLHRSVRPSLYQEIMKKILIENMNLHIMS